MGDSNEVKCEYFIMKKWKMEMEDVNRTMEELIVKAAEVQIFFQESYTGDALPEVNVFFEGLIEHLYRLSVFYMKMSQFIDMTNRTFSENDRKMKENMGG